MTPRGRCPARDIFDGLDDDLQAEFAALFRRLGDVGHINDDTKFKRIAGYDLYELRKKRTRFIGNYRGARFVIAHGILKKDGKIPRQDLKTALRVLRLHDELEEGADHP